MPQKSEPTLPRIKYDKPPVIEVVCGAMFNNLESLLVPHIGSFWDGLRVDFPKVQEVSPLPSMTDDLARQGTLQIDLAAGPPLPRVWFISENDQTLIQIQRDRFLYNWKRPDPLSVPYPSYDFVIDEFEKHLGEFESFLDREGLGSLEFRQFELTYVNHISAGTGLPKGNAGGGVLIDHRRDASKARFLPEPVSYNWRSIYQLPGNNGHLIVTALHAQKRDTGEELLRLDLTARGIGNPRSRSAMRTWFDLAHGWIVHGFMDITSMETQRQVWRGPNEQS